MRGARTAPMVPPRITHYSLRLPVEAKGRPVGDLQKYDPSRNYMHILRPEGPSMDDAILEGAPVSAKCGRQWVAKATDFLTLGTDPTIPWCPLCVLVHTYRKDGA